MMVVEDVEAVLWAADDRDHVSGEKFGLLLGVLLLPTLPLGMHLPHPDRDLGGPQFGDRDGMQDWFTDRDHGKISLAWGWKAASLRRLLHVLSGRPYDFA